MMSPDGSDHRCIPDREILGIGPDGIRYAGGFIDFAACAERNGEMRGQPTNCVAERDITTLQITFYTDPLTTIVFLPKHRWGKRAATERFCAFRKQIQLYGYKTYDLS